MRLSVVSRLIFSYLFTTILLVLFAVAVFQSGERLRLSVAAADRSQDIISQLQALLVNLLSAESAAPRTSDTRRRKPIAITIPNDSRRERRSANAVDVC